MVEPVAGVLGAAAVLLIQPLLPFALAFAAGAMIYVVVEELIPESQLDKKTDVATFGAMMGFAVMMRPMSIIGCVLEIGSPLSSLAAALLCVRILRRVQERLESRRSGLSAD
jgi:hypothetical protein